MTFIGKNVVSIGGLISIALTGLVGCATFTPELQAQNSAPVEIALTESPAELKNLADQGSAQAQLAYSFVLRYALNGESADPNEAARYRALATQSRGSTTTAVYAPGALKMPGHTQLLTLPRYDINEAQAEMAEKCASALDKDADGGNVSAQLASGVCGGAQAFAKLKPLWARATGH